MESQKCSTLAILFYTRYMKLISIVRCALLNDEMKNSLAIKIFKQFCCFFFSFFSLSFYFYFLLFNFVTCHIKICAVIAIHGRLIYVALVKLLFLVSLSFKLVITFPAKANYATDITAKHLHSLDILFTQNLYQSYLVFRLTITSPNHLSSFCNLEMLI